MRWCILFIIFCYLFVCVLAFQQNNVLLGSMYTICAILNVVLYYFVKKNGDD